MREINTPMSAAMLAFLSESPDPKPRRFKSQFTKKSKSKAVAKRRKANKRARKQRKQNRS